MSKVSGIVTFSILLAAAFSAGWISGKHSERSLRTTLQSGRYIWEHDRMVVGMDQELVILSDSGYFELPEAYMPRTWFRIEEDHFVVNDTTQLPFFITEEGIGVTWAPGMQQMWKFVE